MSLVDSEINSLDFVTPEDSGRSVFGIGSVDTGVVGLVYTHTHAHTLDHIMWTLVATCNMLPIFKVSFLACSCKSL